MGSCGGCRVRECDEMQLLWVRKLERMVWAPRAGAVLYHTAAGAAAPGPLPQGGAWAGEGVLPAREEAQRASGAAAPALASSSLPPASHGGGVAPAAATAQPAAYGGCAPTAVGLVAAHT